MLFRSNAKTSVESTPPLSAIQILSAPESIFLILFSKSLSRYSRLGFESVMEYSMGDMNGRDDCKWGLYLRVRMYLIESRSIFSLEFFTPNCS